MHGESEALTENFFYKVQIFLDFCLENEDFGLPCSLISLRKLWFSRIGQKALKSGFLANSYRKEYFFSSTFLQCLKDIASSSFNL